MSKRPMARQKLSFRERHEQFEYSRLVQARQSTGRRVDHCILADALDVIRDRTRRVEVFDQHVIGFEHRQRSHGQASRLVEPARFSLEQQRAKGGNRLPTASGNFNDAANPIVKRFELIDCCAEAL
jgi:hypothetical protein